jgi:hypothetical protein
MLRGKYVLLTRSYKKAILLEYFVMRQEKSADWISASFPTISKESLLSFSIPALKNYIDELVDNKWIACRIDPKATFGSPYQYKVDIEKIKQDVEEAKKKALQKAAKK